MFVSTNLAIRLMYGFNSFAPNAQLKPNARGFKCLTEYQNASQVWPIKVLPDLSVIVPETIEGILILFSSK